MTRPTIDFKHSDQMARELLSVGIAWYERVKMYRVLAGWNQHSTNSLEKCEDHIREALGHLERASVNWRAKVR